MIDVFQLQAAQQERSMTEQHAQDVLYLTVLNVYQRLSALDVIEDSMWLKENAYLETLLLLLSMTTF